MKFIFIFFLLGFFIIFQNYSHLKAESPHFVDFKYILNQSEAGKKAQSFLKNKLEKGLKEILEKEKKIQQDEKKIIEQKKILSPEEYKKKVTNLRKDVTLLQKQRQNLLSSVSKQRNKAKSELLKNLNPIIQDYMNEKKIRMVIDKKSILLADENLDLTDEIISKLNKKIKSINLN